MVRSHFVVVADENGQPSKHPLKRWLRDNPSENPPGLHPSENTSHALRGGLKKLGWKLEFAPNEVLIIKPDAQGQTAYSDELVEEADIEDSPEASEALEESAELQFGLEKDLQLALRADIGQLDPGLSMIDGGTEFSTGAGRVDILAKDAQGTTVVVELKAGRADTRVIAQVLAYMTTVAAEKSMPVRGIIVAGDFDERVVLAARAVPNLELKRYSYQFKFDQVE
jgi:hypothetical protein